MQSALGFAPRALAARSWLRSLGLALPCPHAAPPQHQDPQAGAVYRQTPLQQSRWLSASAATANKMPVPSTGVAPQGGVASTAVEGAWRTVDALWARQMELWATAKKSIAAEIELLRLSLLVTDIRDSGCQSIDVAHKERLRACGITDAENPDDVLAELKKLTLTSVSFESVSKQLETAWRDLATAWTKQRDALAAQALLTAEELLTNLPEGWQIEKLESDTSLLDRDKDFTAVNKYLAAVQKKSAHGEPQGGGEVRTALYLIYAVKGGGKTCFLKMIAREHAVKNKHGGAGIFVSYNDATIVPEVTRDDELRCFAVRLLRRYGVPDDVAKRVASLDAALAFMRKSMEMNDLAPLTICVDEIAVLDRQKVEGYDPAQKTIRALMQYQDSITNAKSARGRVYFIFSSLVASFVNQTKTDSSRVILKHGLKNLRKESALALLSQQSKDRMKNSAVLGMVFASLAGHPRAVVEGFNKMVADYDGTVAFLGQLLRGIMTQCKFDHTYGFMTLMETAVSEWIAGTKLDSCQQSSRLMGWLQECSTGEEVLTPLVLRCFSEADKALPESTLRKELRQLYYTDLAVGDETEKEAENLLRQFEIVKKLSHRRVRPNYPVLLKDFFAGGAYADPVFGDTCLYIDSPRVSFVSTFAPSPADDGIARLLLSGSTVVSKLQREPGVEYLSPFFKRPSDPLRPYEYADLLVAMVQVKYLNPRTQSTTWGKYSKKVGKSPAKAYLDATHRKIANFTVFYTISTKLLPRQNMKVNTVYYNRGGMKTFLKKLGPLRYHEEKSGEMKGMCRRGGAHYVPQHRDYVRGRESAANPRCKVAKPKKENKVAGEDG